MRIGSLRFISRRAYVEPPTAPPFMPTGRLLAPTAAALALMASALISTVTPLAPRGVSVGPNGRIVHINGIIVGPNGHTVGPNGISVHANGRSVGLNGHTVGHICHGILEMRRILLPFLLIILAGSAMAQRVSFQGTVTDAQQAPLFGVIVHVEGKEDNFITDEEGQYIITGLNAGLVKLTFFQPGYKKEERTIDAKNGRQTLDIQLQPLSVEVQDVVVKADRTTTEKPMTRLKAVDGFGIYAGRKTEVIQMTNINANLGANRARQAFARVAGLNIWESDCSGIQIGVGARGLSPSRSENFNTRQNGYDIAADALGYPESYYSPPHGGIGAGGSGARCGLVAIRPAVWRHAQFCNERWPAGEEV
jgi:hypothetical protein